MIDSATSVRRWGRLGIGLLALALVLTGCDAFISQDLGNSDPQTPSVTEIVTEVPALSRLEEGLQTSNLVDDLQGSGPFTVIAPDNGAFAPIGEGELSKSALLKTVLRGHVIAGQKIAFEDIDAQQTVQTLAGEQITLGPGGSINGTDLSVINADVNATNGVVHVVDGVFADAVNRISVTADYTILERLVQREGLVGALRADGLTIFAPSNDAFLAARDEDDSGAIEEDELQGIDVSEVLQEHIHDGVFSAASFLDDDDDAFPKDTTLTNLNDRDISIRATAADPDSVSVNPNDENAAVATPDVKTRNGRIHGIDTVLLP
jgi:uncharacterized surface protein with fasciclin (FAS1) repeats